MEGFRETFIQRGWKDSEGIVLQAAPDEEFLHEKINNRDVYVNYGTEDSIPEVALEAVWRFDSIELK